MRAQKGPNTWGKITALEEMSIERHYPDRNLIPTKEVTCPDCLAKQQATPTQVIKQPPISSRFAEAWKRFFRPSATL